jgi:hypothetical protein
MCDKLRIIKDESFDECIEDMNYFKNSRPSLKDKDADIFVLEDGVITQIQGNISYKPA